MIDYKKYPPNWKTEIRPAVLERADNCCEKCGLFNHQKVYSVKHNGQSIWFELPSDALRCAGVPHLHGYEKEVKQVRVVLTIAHLNHDITDNRMENLKALCQKCHLNHDKELHARNARKTREKKAGLQNLFEA